jgi:hypothetical protein
METLIPVIVLVSIALFFLYVAAQRFGRETVALFSEAAYYSALRPNWPQLHVNGQTYAILPEHAERFRLRDGDELTLAELEQVLWEIKEFESCMN